ncbi:hypothetical protein U3516DRAFT_769467 [Neocallimastix sp. 'constans']
MIISVLYLFLHHTPTTSELTTIIKYKCVGLVDSYTLGLTKCNEYDTNPIFYFSL